jgi:hypothetical protein
MKFIVAATAVAITLAQALTGKVIADTGIRQEKVQFAKGASPAVITGNAGTRSLLFVQGTPVASNAQAMDALGFERKGELTIVTLGTSERYEIPDVLVAGG